MTAVALDTSQIRAVFPAKADIFDFVAAVALTAGDVVYLNTSGLAALADANAAGLQQAIGIVMKDAAAGEAVSVLKEGHVYGFTLTSLAYGAPLYLSDTAGDVDDAAGTLEVNIGRVMALSDKPNYTKVAYFNFEWNNQAA